MGHYAEWQVIVNKVLELIRNNEPLLKLVSNYGPSPYNTEAPSWENIIMKNVFPMPKEPDAVHTEKTFINVYMYRGVMLEDNPSFRNDYLFIEVGCHIETWKLDNGEIRPYTMCDLIDEMLDNQYINDMSIQKVLPIENKALKFGDMFYGYRMMYKLTNVGGISCG